MTTYADLISKYKDTLIIECYKTIDNTTLQHRYSIYTNLHCEYGICDDMMLSFASTSKSKFNKEVAELKKLTGFKLRLIRTDNDKSYTRLIYRMLKR